MQKSIRFFMMMLPAFLARVKPVSTMAKPACIQNTSAAPIKNQNSTVIFFHLLISIGVTPPPAMVSAGFDRWRYDKKCRAAASKKMLSSQGALALHIKEKRLKRSTSSDPVVYGRIIERHFLFVKMFFSN